MEEPKLNAIVTLRNEVSPWLMILQVVPDCWTFPDYVPGHVTRLGLLGLGQAGTYGRYKNFCHIACMKQPSVKGFPFFRLE